MVAIKLVKKGFWVGTKDVERIGVDHLFGKGIDQQHIGLVGYEAHRIGRGFDHLYGLGEDIGQVLEMLDDLFVSLMAILSILIELERQTQLDGDIEDHRRYALDLLVGSKDQGGLFETLKRCMGQGDHRQTPLMQKLPIHFFSK